MRRRHPTHRPGFTLVELLMVVAIIGILVGLLVPAVMYARKVIMQRALAFEVQGLANAVEAYKTKYGDYPPDGTDWQIFQRHIRKAFPQIAATEFDAVLDVCNCAARPTPNNASVPTSVMDPAEALVFFLGGFSSDPIHPFTGSGGPLVASPAGSAVVWMYNPDRDSPFFPFKAAQLSLTNVADPTSNQQITVSNDETTFGFGVAIGFPAQATFAGVPGDCMPVYRPSGKTAPYVYFDSRSYSLQGVFFNRYQTAANGTARPYKEGNDTGPLLNTKITAVAGATTAADLATNDVRYRYANDRSFQIICAGLDDSFGGTGGAGVPTFFMYPNGMSLNISNGTTGTTTRYSESAGVVSQQLDNTTNFSEGTLSDALPN